MKSMLLATFILLSGIGVADQARPERFIRTAEVADLLFPKMEISYEAHYLERLMLRFSDPDMQIVITETPEGPNVMEYTIDSKESISGMIRRLREKDSNVTAADIAKKLKVKEKAITVSSEQAGRWWEEFRQIKVSPAELTGICLHGCPYYELWFDTHQDAIRFLVAYSPETLDQHSPQEQIAKWMLKVRTDIRNIGNPHREFHRD